ncbi:UDP-glycosyltransferase 86A1-like [Humulus lupulus]|uniref:UDP-glycosyltransferase 86A1-like n=1 Tax=Humulus lupulus TaxID=3486 RepID=UPI002B40E7CB|nr:UDP-glycosyltransferase 86A1-like [Humulus lupulus]
MPVPMEEFIQYLVESADPPVSVLIADTFFGWHSTIAKRYDLVSMSFCTVSALVFSLYYHLDLLKMNDNRKDIIDYILGSRRLSKKIYPLTLSFINSMSTRNAWSSKKCIRRCEMADMFICNIVHELEFEPISAIQENHPMYAIGPLISPLGFTNSLVPTNLMPESDCTHWLNSKLPKSVLYISLGSFVPCGKKEIDEIAQGLMLSKVNFIWVLRPNVVGYTEPYVLPIGFEDEVKDRGLIVSWTNQNEVISHHEIGGFLTHFCWNSTLESLWYGVTMLYFSLMTDQLTNKKLLVDEVNLCDKKSLRLEVAEKINKLMCGKLVDELREKTTNVKQIMKNGLALNGSLDRNLYQFISDVTIKICDRSIP